MSDPAVEAAQRAWPAAHGANDVVLPAFDRDMQKVAADGAREALNWAADVIAQEAREQWTRDHDGFSGAALIAQRMDLMEKVIRGEK